jgi:hypothetical protein
MTRSRLAIRVVERSGSIVADVVEQARSAEQSLSPPLIARITDAATSHFNTVSNQADLVTSFGSLLDKVGILVKLGDEVAKVCP